MPAFLSQDPMPGELSLRAIDLGALVGDFAATLGRILPRSIEVDLSVEEGLPPIRADPGAIEQALLNLATNARDAMPAGGYLKITVRRSELRAGPEAVARGAAPGPYLCLAVTDTGHGMTEAVKRRVFEPPFTTKPGGKGTGLGMAVVFGLVTRHRGLIELESAPGRGTTVLIYLPEA